MNIPRLTLKIMCAGALTGFIALAGCRTTGNGEKDRGPLIAFEPAVSLAKLHVEKGDYPSLFSSDSYALWGGPDLTQQRRRDSEQAGEAIDEAADALAPQLDANFLVFECHLESMFEDMAIGYDVVRLRLIEVYLQTPDGRRVTPAQIIVGSQREESQHGALKAFKRTNLVVFPRADVGLNIPARPRGNATARLVFEGYNSVFYFEWFPRLPGKVPAPDPLTAQEAARARKMGYNEFYRRAGEALHRFD